MLLVLLWPLFQIVRSISYLDVGGTGFDSLSFFTVLDLFLTYFYPKILCSSFVGAFFTLVFCLPENVVEFLAVCSQHFILIILVLVFLLSMQLLHFCWYFLLKLFSNLMQIFPLFLSNLFLFICYVIISSLVISAKAGSSFLIPFILSHVHLTHSGIFVPFLI
jgi:hypothetical protein